MWVKICGIQNKGDLQTALEAGADAVGFLHPSTASPRAAGQIPELLRETGNQAETVLVVSLSSPDEIISAWKAFPADTVQIISPRPATLGALRGAPFRIIAALGADKALTEFVAPHRLLLDSAKNGKLGGTGRACDWKLSATARARFPGDVILAGGLGPDNVRAAISEVAPYGVDASSRLCDKKGNKDPELCQEFVRQAREPI